MYGQGEADALTQIFLNWSHAPHALPRTQKACRAALIFLPEPEDQVGQPGWSVPDVGFAALSSHRALQGGAPDPVGRILVSPL